MEVNVTFGKQRHQLNLSDGATALDVKVLLQPIIGNSDIEPRHMRLLLRGKELDDSSKLDKAKGAKRSGTKLMLLLSKEYHESMAQQQRRGRAVAARQAADAAIAAVGTTGITTLSTSTTASSEQAAAPRVPPGPDAHIGVDASANVCAGASASTAADEGMSSGAESVHASASDFVVVLVRGKTKTSLSLKDGVDTTFGQVKAAAAVATGLTPSAMRLVACGKTPSDNDTLRSAKITKSGAKLMLLYTRQQHIEVEAAASIDDIHTALGDVSRRVERELSAIRHRLRSHTELTLIVQELDAAVTQICDAVEHVKGRLQGEAKKALMQQALELQQKMTEIRKRSLEAVHA